MCQLCLPQEMHTTKGTQPIGSSAKETVLSFHPGFQKTGTLANSEDPDEMLQKAAFHRGLHCLHKASFHQGLHCV